MQISSTIKANHSQKFLTFARIGRFIAGVSISIEILIMEKNSAKHLQTVDKATYELQEKVIAIIWDWISVQVPLDKISLFISKIRSTVVENLDEYYPRECAFLVYCDARFTPPVITRELAKSTNVDINHIESNESSWAICKKLHRFHSDYDPGIIALISGASAAYGPVLTKLSRCGWHIQLFHPENTSREYAHYGDRNWSIERLLDGEIENININTNFPHTVHFLITELCNNDESLGFLTNITEQYQTRVIYFNEKAAEAIIELKAFDIEGAISLLEARIRACSPNNGVLVASTTDAYRLEILTSAYFLSNIKIAKLTNAPNERPNIQYPNTPTDVGTLEATIDITSAAIAHVDTAAAATTIFNIASSATAAANITTHTAIPQHTTSTPAATTATATATATFDPYVAEQIAATTTTSQLLQEQHELQQQVMQQLKVSNCNMDDTTIDYEQNKNKELEDDSKSHKEVKVEVFTEDEDDYGVEEDAVCAVNQNDNRNSWEMECNKSLNENTNMAMNHSSYDGAANYNIAEYVNEYPPLPNTESGSPLCYSAVVKGIKPLNNNNNKPSSNPIKDCSNVATPQRHTSSMTSVSTQMSQWDQMVIERGGKFNKPAPQCIHWNNPKHRLDFPCRFWHPREQCRYYPNCSNTADECGFAHPFCGDFCRCPRGKRDPQKNHRIPEERYFGSGDRMKYATESDVQ
ncbi:hypothetical protein QQG55_34525 [Brugia pahangi]